MSYLTFVVIFLVVPIGALVVAYRRGAARWPWGVFAGLALVALAYTGPWDNALIANGVWAFGRGRVVGTIGLVPIEEYVFYVLQVVLTGIVTTLILGRRARGRD
ncbi:MAG: hypothetical protein NVSMB65_12610 [Chloroflexota bacterium]